MPSWMSKEIKDLIRSKTNASRESPVAVYRTKECIQDYREIVGRKLVSKKDLKREFLTT